MCHLHVLVVLCFKPKLMTYEQGFVLVGSDKFMVKHVTSVISLLMIVHHVFILPSQPFCWPKIESPVKGHSSHRRVTKYRATMEILALMLVVSTGLGFVAGVCVPWLIYVEQPLF